MQLALTPELFAEDADPSASPSCAILNPERGFHDYSDLRSLDADTLEDALAGGMTVLYVRAAAPEPELARAASDESLDSPLLPVPLRGAEPATDESS